MYWFRDGNPLQLLPWLGITLVWLIGGWLIARHAFNMERRERLIVGAGLGLCSYLWFANLLGHWLPPMITFTLAGFIVLVIGVAFAWRGERPVLDWRDFKVWSLLLVGLLLIYIFAQIGKGLGLFDDHKNLSIISTMATGDIPSHFYMNPDFYFSYHYGFQLLGASLMRLGGFFPWSAFDFSKALVGAWSVLLAYLLGVRYLKSEFGGAILAVVLTLATGTRYLLLLLPPALLIEASSKISLAQTSSKLGAPFFLALTKKWAVDGGPPIPFVFGFLNGIMPPHFLTIQAGPPALAIVILLLVWLLASRGNRTYSFVIFVILFSFWALAFESSYALFFAGGGLIALYYLWKRCWTCIMRSEYYALLLSIPFAIFQGGSITEILRKQILGYEKPVPAALKSVVDGFSFAGFSLRWPPAIISAHLSPLRIDSPLEVLVALFEIGPIILFTPWITIWAWRRFKEGNWINGVLILSSWIGFLAPIVLSYRSERDITRLSAYALVIWMIFFVFLIWEYSGYWSKFLKVAGVTSLSLMVFGGIVIAGISLTAAAQPIISSGITRLDAMIASDVWDTLPYNDLVFDPEKWRATTVTGRFTRAGAGIRKTLPEWEQLRADPSIEGFLEYDFTYIYIDEEWWNELAIEKREALSDPCIQVISEHWDSERDKFRRLISLNGCILQ